MQSANAKNIEDILLL